MKVAFEFFRKAAELDNQAAQYNLAYIYAKGLGVEADGKLARDWYRRACRSPCDFPPEIRTAP